MNLAGEKRGFCSIAGDRAEEEKCPGRVHAWGQVHVHSAGSRKGACV